MLRRVPLKPKRATPRRNEGRVQHERLKPKAKAAPTAEEKRHIERVAALGCLVCGKPAHVHHVMHAPGKSRRRDHRFIVPLCPDHHQGREGVHGLGSEAAFFARWGIDLVAWCIGAWEQRAASHGHGKRTGLLDEVQVRKDDQPEDEKRAVRQVRGG